MAEQADGSIIVDTELDTKGFKAGSTELHSAIKSLSKKVEALGPVFQKEISGGASAIANFNGKAAALENTIQQIEAKMESLGNTQVSTDDYVWLTREIEKANRELDKLYDREAKMKAAGVQKNSKAWQSLQYDISLAKQKISEYTYDLEGLKAEGQAFAMGSATPEYAALGNDLAVAKARLAEMRAEAEKANGSTDKFSKTVNILSKSLSGIRKVGKKAFSGIASVIKKAASRMKLFNKHTNRASFSMNSFSGKMRMMIMMIKQMIIMRAFMGVITAISDGFKNLAQYSDKTNSELSALKSSLTQLKNSLASAFTPILTVVTPALVKFVNLLSIATNYIAQLFATLTGATTYIRAKEVQEDFAASLEGTADAADKAKNSLSSFDDLNVVTNSKDANTGEALPEDMFEEVPVESKITDFIGRLKTIFENGDYDSIGAAIGNGINKAVQKINGFIKQGNIGDAITNLIKSVAEGFNSLVHTVNWTQIGDTFAQGFNAAINTLFLILTEFDWLGLAAGLANNLNGVVSGFDWAKLGMALSTGMRTAIATLRKAITAFDWVALGKGVADGINSIDWVGILSDLAASISDILKAALDLLISFIDNLDWAKLGNDLWNSLMGIVTNIDWGGIIAKAIQLLVAARISAASLIVGFAKAIWGSLKSAFESTKNNFIQYIDEAGGNVILGLLHGIWNGIMNIGQWVKDNIFTPFINGFKSAFGIHSPSAVMAEMGRHLVEDLLQGIQNMWSSITTFIRNALTSLKNTITSTLEGIKSSIFYACSAISSAVSSAWNNIKSEAVSAWNGIKFTVTSATNSVKSAVSTAWNNIKSITSAVCSNVKSTVSSAWNTVKRSVSSTMKNVRSTASTVWNNVKSTVSEVCSSIKSTVSSSWNHAKTSISNAVSTIKTNVSNTFSNLKNSASTWGKDLCQNMADGISKAKSTVESAVKGVADKIKSFLGFSEPEDGPLSNFHTYMPDMLNLMAKGIIDNENVAISAVSDLAEAISDEVQSGENCFTIDAKTAATSEIGGFLTAFSDKVADSFVNLISHLQAIANGVTFTMPIMAGGTVIPYHMVCVCIDKSDSTDKGSSDILEELHALKEKLDNVVEAIENKETGITDAQIYASVKQSVRKEEKTTGRSPF